MDPRENASYGMVNKLSNDERVQNSVANSTNRVLGKLLKNLFERFELF